jgi:hypothetical protein
MREGLRVVAEMGAGGRVHLFAVQPERVGQTDELVQPRRRCLDAAGRGEGLDQPEAARQEGSFTTGEPIAAGWVAVDERCTSVEAEGDGGDGDVKTV